MHQRHSDDTELYHGNDFGEKVAFTVGTSFCLGFFLGLGKGIKNGKQTSRHGNAFAAAGLMYYFVSATLNLFFEDEFEEMTPIHKNMLCGGVSGMVFKSTLGVVPAAVGGVLGVALIGGLTKVVEEGNQRGLIAFEMK